MSAEALLRIVDVQGGEHRVPVAAAVFDCDGLLVDSESVWLHMLEGWLSRHGVGADREPNEFLGLSVTETAVRLAALSDALSPAGVAADLTERYSALLASGVTAMPGATRVVAGLAAAVPTAVASNGIRADVRSMLADTGLLPRLRAVITLDDVAAGKPAPDMYALACRTLGAAEHRAIAFEDSPTGATAATAAGLIVVGVNADLAVRIPCHIRVGSLDDVAVIAAADDADRTTPDSGARDTEPTRPPATPSETDTSATQRTTRSTE